MICCFCSYEPSRQSGADLMLASPDAMLAHDDIYAVIGMFLSRPYKVCWFSVLELWMSPILWSIGRFRYHLWIWLRYLTVSSLNLIEVPHYRSVHHVLPLLLNVMLFCLDVEPIRVFAVDILAAEKGTDLQYKINCLLLIMHYLPLNLALNIHIWSCSLSYIGTWKMHMQPCSWQKLIQ
jgi:hypothetical protein